MIIIRTETAKSNMKSTAKSAIFMLIGIAALFGIFFFSDTVKLGVKSGIEVCLCLLIPSLFLPLIICSFIQQTGGLQILGRPLEPLANRLFRLNAATLAVFLICLLSGYPSGAVMLRQLYDSKMISKAQARRMSNIAVCAGPAFILLGVGDGMLNSRISGIILLASHICAALFLLIFDSIIHRKDSYEKNSLTEKSVRLMNSAVNSVNSAARSMTMICALTLIFSSVNAVADKFGTPFNIISVTLCEPTNACLYYASIKNLPLIAAVLGFSGFSIIAQVCAALGSVCNIKQLLVYRMINAAASYIICTAFLRFFPQIQAVSSKVGFIACIKASSSTPTLSALLIICAILLICSSHQRKIRPISDFFSS